MITDGNADILMIEMYGDHRNLVSPTMETALTYLLKLRDVSIRETLFQRMFIDEGVTNRHVEQFIQKA